MNDRGSASHVRQRELKTMPVKKLYCVEYPGKVVNPDRMVETLGGIDSLSNAFSNTQKKLELKFRPEDKFCKGVTAERSKKASFLLKVVVKRVKSADKNEPDKKEIIRTSVVGRVCRTFTFTGLMDFQYLPMEKNTDGKFESVYDSVVPKDILPLSWLNEEAPLCMIPAFFCRTDSMQPYLQSNKPVDETSATIGRTRDRRSNYVKFVNHGEAEVPKQPYPITLRYIQMKMVQEKEIVKIIELFDERPIWTKIALSCVTRFPNVQLKYLLSLRAYHFTSGPFRIAWVRFGYDPRTDSAARNYQIVDYRIRANILTVLRSLDPERYAPSGRTKTKNPDEESDDKFDEDYYIFKPGSLPPQKQMFYQACDIKIPEVEEKLREYSQSQEYDPKHGWLSESILEFIREQMDTHIITVLQSKTAGSSTSPSTEMLLMRKVNISDVDQSSSESSISDLSNDDFDDSNTDEDEDDEVDEKLFC